MKRLILLLTLSIATILSSSKSVNAQEEVDFSERFFMSFNSSTYTDFVKSPIRTVSAVVANRPNPNDPFGPGIPVYAEVPYQSWGWSLFSLGLEPRFNVYEMNDEAALAISIPFSFGMYQVVPASNEVGGNEAFGGIQIPILAKLYLGSSSTYESEKDFGISLGIGMEFNKLGLVNVNGGEGGEGNGGWMMPVSSLGIHFWRGSMPMEINLKFGFGPRTDYFVNKFGDPLKDSFGNLTSGSSRASSFKLTFGYLLNY